MTDLIKTIQSRLKRENINLPRQDIITRITEAGYDPDNLNESDLDSIVSVIIQSRPSELTVVNNNSDTIEQVKEQQAQVLNQRLQDMGLSKEMQTEFLTRLAKSELHSVQEMLECVGIIQDEASKLLSAGLEELTAKRQNRGEMLNTFFRDFEREAETRTVSLAQTRSEILAIFSK